MSFECTHAHGGEVQCGWRHFFILTRHWSAALIEINLDGGCPELTFGVNPNEGTSPQFFPTIFYCKIQHFHSFLL